MQDLDALMRLAQRQLSLIEEQASPDKRELKSEDARIMSGDRGPFADKMKDDPFEYEIVGDVCNDKEGIQFKVVGFTNRATARFKRRWTKITKGSTQRSFAKGKYIWKRGPLKGKDSWDILRDKIGGGDVICQLVSEAEGTGKEEKPGKSDEELVDEEDFQVTIGGKKKKPEPEPEPEADKGAPEPVSGSKPGSLKYYIENNTTGMDEDIKNYTGLSDFTPQDPARKFFKDALTNARKKERNQQKYSPANIGYGLMELSDEPRAGLASRRLIAALKLMLNRRFPPGVVDRINDLRSRILNTVAKGDRSVINKIAQDKSDALASELNMPFFGTVTAAPAEEPASDKKPKPGVKPKKTDKVKVPAGNLIGKDVPLEGMKMKITSSRLFLDGKPYKAVVDAGLAGNIDLSFNSAKFTSGGDRVFLTGKIVGAKATAAAAVGIPTSGEGEIFTKDLVRYAKQLKTKGEVTVTEFNPPLKIVPASMAEALYMSPDQINIFVLSELKSIGFIEDQKEAAMKITAGKLRQIIREELGREEVSAEDLVILNIPAPKDDKGNVDEEEAQKRAVEIVMGSEHDQANSFFIDKGRMYFFASADDLRSWQQMTKEDRMDKPAPAAKEKSYMQMSDEELIAKVPAGQMRNRMGGPGRDLFMGLREDDPVPTPTEDLKFVMDKWETVRDIPGATLSIRRYPDDYKKKHQFDRGRPNMIWGDVNYPSLD